ncbi:MAG: FAD-dependent thymidylate synthase [Clostridia bacterium]|nr:FAD-dependent thymidylate synthase [Clostridia bacterium]
MKVKLKSITTKNMVEYIADFARVSRDRDGIETTTEQDLKLCKRLWKDGERTAFESINLDFLVEDVSRSLLAQITRYRHATFMVESQRYVKYDNKVDFVIPDFDNIKYKDSDSNDNSRAKYAAKNSCDDSIKAYSEMIRLGAKPEDARCVLPNAMPTRFRIVCNLHSFLHFYQQRSNPHAQTEIRNLAYSMFNILLRENNNAEERSLCSFIDRSFTHTLKDLHLLVKVVTEREEGYGFDKVREIKSILKEYEEFV